MVEFIGRKKELKQLKEFTAKKSASLIVIRGRRRIGKSRLVEEFAKPYTFFRFSGIVPNSETTIQSQCEEFSYQLGLALGMPGIKGDNWNTLFLLLAGHIKTGRIIVLFDEISWMGSKDPDFLGKFKNSWDIHFNKNPQLLFILCGSASSWIEKNILSNTGFLGRISYTMTLEELSLIECSQFWGKANKHIDPFEKLKVLAITGGVPKYLEEINPHISAEDNIKKLCFSKGGFLADEFKKIFSDLFLKHSEFYKKIVKILASGSKEIKEICTLLKTSQSGRITGFLFELELAGFIRRDYTWHIHNGVDSKLSKYRLSDNYIRFYLKYIDQYFTKIQRNSFDFKSLTTLPEWNTILGLQFENLVLNNRLLMHKSLNILAEDIVSENPFFQKKTTEQHGCQIDYLVQTKYNVLYICEIKFSKHKIGVEVVKEVERKMASIKIPKGFSMRAVLVHVNGVSDELIDLDFFSSMINFSDFL